MESRGFEYRAPTDLAGLRGLFEDNGNQHEKAV